MPRLLIDATPVSVQAKGVGRYAYHLCLQVATRLPEDWSLQVLVHEEGRELFPEKFRGELIPIRKTSEIAGAVFTLRSLVKRLQPQILLKSYESAGRVAGIPTVTVCHDIDELILEAQGAKRPLSRRLIDESKYWLRRRALQHSEFVICNSEFTRSGIRDHYKIPESRTVVAYCAIDPRFYQVSRSVDKEATRKRYAVRNYVLSFATGDPRENFKCLPAVVARLRDLKVQTCMLVAGIKPGTSYASDLRVQFHNLGLVEGTHFTFENFLGADQFDELAGLYAAADFYLELSLHEGFGMQLAEAMACGTTCITSPNGALAEIGDGQVIFIDPENVEGIAMAIKTSYANGLHSRDNREQVRYTLKFSWDEMGKVVTGILLQIADKRRERAG